MQRLVNHGHRLPDIANYTLDQFVVFLDAVERADAVSRLVFITDMGTVVGGIFGGGDQMKTHLASLREIANGE